MRDIENRQDIDHLMKEFYGLALTDDVIGYIFTDVAKISLEHHLPIIGDFWEKVIFQTGDYGRHGRNPLMVHIALNMQESLRVEHFKRWLEIFGRVIDENFSGENATKIKQRAAFMAERIYSVCNGENTIIGRH